MRESKDQVIESAIWVNPARMSGAPCFLGTRIPIQQLFDYLADGVTVEEFEKTFSWVEHEQIVKVLELARIGKLRPLTSA